MSGFLRNSYRATDLDPITGPIPTFGNPGGVESPGMDGRRDSWCVPCGVEWVGGGTCWCCGGAG